MLKAVSGCLFGATCLSMVTAANPTTSPAAHTDLICATDNAADCYPRIFQPTEDFQVIRDGQDLPLGLHVRMNVWTGEKEARLNIPIDGDIQLDGILTEQSVVIVDQPRGSGIDDEPALRDRVPQSPPVYEAAGKILPPREPNGSGGDSENFWNAIYVLGGTYFDGTHPVSDDIELALTDLSDLAHDIYYGVELAKRGDILRNLIALMLSDSPHHRRQAASVLGASVQNNPTALKEARKAWKSLMNPGCGKDAKDKTTCETEAQSLIKQIYQSLQQETDPVVTKAKISALAGLTKDLDMRDAFLVDGMGLLLTIFLKEGTEWDSTRVKIARYVMDTFLDEDMGAQLGVWPKHKSLNHKQCSQAKKDAREGCWEYHLEKMELEHGDGTDGWRSEFLRLLGSSTDAAGVHVQDIPVREL